MNAAEVDTYVWLCIGCSPAEVRPHRCTSMAQGRWIPCECPECPKAVQHARDQ